MNSNGPTDSGDWAETFDDMHGGDWEEHFALYEPQDDDLEGHYTAELDLYQRPRRQSPDRLEQVERTVTLADLAQQRCLIEAKCLSCFHRAILTPEYFLAKVLFSITIHELRTKLFCQKCGARSPTCIPSSSVDV